MTSLLAAGSLIDINAVIALLLGGGVATTLYRLVIMKPTKDNLVIEGLNEGVTGLVKVNEATKKELKEALDKIDLIAAKLDDALHRILILESDEADKDKKVAALTAQVKTLEETVKRVSRERDDKHKENQRLIADFSTQLEEKDKRISTLESQVATLQHDNPQS